MSSTTKKKHVTKEVLEEYALPEGERQIVKITAARGNNLHEVVTADGQQFLVSMPPKFRKHVWVKRGDFLMIEPIHEGDKVKGEITHILFDDQIKHIRDNGMWPESFAQKLSRQNDSMIPDDLLPPCDSDCSDDELGDRVINMNRVYIRYEESESSDSCSEEEEEEAEEEEEKEQEESSKESSTHSSPLEDKEKNVCDSKDNLDQSSNEQIENKNTS